MHKLNAPRLSLRGLSQPDSPAMRVFMDPPVLETPRLRLRRLRMRDAEDLYVWTSDPEVARYVLWSAHRSLADTREYLRYMRQLYRHALPSSWGSELKETGKIIGTIGIMAWYPDNRSAEVGYSLGKPWWHKGYAPEALDRLLELMFGEMDLNRVEAQCDVRNGNSARVMEKCGMRREGILRQRVINKGEPVDVMLYAELAEEYTSAKRRNE